MGSSTSTPQGEARLAAGHRTQRLGRFAGTVLAVTLACSAQRAGANFDDLCSDYADQFLRESSQTNPDQFTTAGCDAADELAICELRGSGGLCSADPECPDNQIETFGCTRSDEVNACCYKEFRKPPCESEGCEPVLTACLSICNGPAPPPPTEEERRDAVCADFADLSLPRLADDFPEGFVVGCDGAAAGQTCDLNGSGGSCADVPECAGNILNGNDCSAATAASGCCVVSLTRPCDDCTPELGTCIQTCGDSAPVPSTDAPQSVSDQFCAMSAMRFFNKRTGIDSDLYDESCDDAGTRTTCDLQSSAGACEGNPACSGVQIVPFLCSDETGPPLCCDVLFQKACDDCEPTVSQCRNICGSDGSPPAPGEVERGPGFVAIKLDEPTTRCIDEAEIALAQMRIDNPDLLESGCDDTALGEECDVVGVQGNCLAAFQCTDYDDGRGAPVDGPLCSAAEEEGSCCRVYFAQVCSDGSESGDCSSYEAPVRCEQVCAGDIDEASNARRVAPIGNGS